MTINRAFFRTLNQDESGQDLVEYALATGLIGLAAIVSIKSVGTGIASAFDNLSSRLNAAI